MKRWIERLRARRNEPRHLQTGRWGEKIAARFLKSNGLKIVGERVRVGRHDEIDLVARDGAALIFVEVKTRASEAFGRPFAAVNAEKKRRLSRAAVAYLKIQKIEPDHIRFDVVEVVGTPGGDGPEVRHIENAFQLDRRYKLWW